MDAALRSRLATLRVEGDCCQDLAAVVKAAKAAPGLDAARTRFEAMADPGRLLVAAMLKRYPELCGCEIQAALQVSHATVSHHMRLLQDAGIVEAERRGRWVYYRLTAAVKSLVP